MPGFNKETQKERIGGGIAFHGVPANNCKKLLVFKELHDQGQCRVLGAVQTCQILYQFRIESCYLFLSLKTPRLGHFSSSPKASPAADSSKDMVNGSIGYCSAA